MSALVLAPVGALAAAVWSLRRHGLPLAEAALVAAVLAATWAAAGAELCSSFGLLARLPLLGWWLAGLGLAAWTGWRRGAPTPEARPEPGTAPLPERLEIAALWALIGLLLAWTAAQALLAPPNTADVLAYHMPRQVHWLQQGSLAHYPTSVLRQLAMPPLSELIGVNLLALTGGDRWHNLVQWGALGGLALVVSALVKREGGDTRCRLWAVLATLAIPPLFVQASSSKNDLLVALWLALLAYWGLFPPAWLERTGAVGRGALTGVVLGDLVLTKGTGMLFAVPVLGAMAWRARRDGTGRVLAIAGLVALAVNLPHWARNTAAFGSPLGPPAVHGDRFVNELFSPAAALSNLARTAAPQLALPTPGWNAALDGAIDRLHGWIGLSPDDARTTWRLPPYRPVRLLQASEDTAAAPGHAYLVLLLLLPSLRRRLGAVPTTLLVLAGSGFVLFCVALKWQFWHSRLLGPLFALCVPALALSWGASRAGRAVATAWLALFLLPTLNFIQRPLLGPSSLFLAGRASALVYGLPGQAGYLLEVARVAHDRRPRTVGFHTGDNAPEYPLQTLLARVVEPPPRYTAFNATFLPEGTREPAPELVISTLAPDGVVQHASTGGLYAVFARAGPFSLLAPWSLDEALAAADAVVLGRLASVSPAGSGSAVAPLEVECVFRGPEVPTLNLLIGDATADVAIRQVAYPAGTRGIWLLQAGNDGAFVTPDSGALLPVSEVESIQDLLGEPCRPPDA